MSRAFATERPIRIPGQSAFGTIEAIVLCDMHARRLDYEAQDGRDIGTRGCVVCGNASWEEVHAAHMIIFDDGHVHAFDPIDVPDFTIKMPEKPRRRATRRT
jgi:hypothetical protein